MADRSARARKRPRRLAQWKTQVAIGAMLAALMTTLTAGISPPAQAAPGCPDGLGWAIEGSPPHHRWVAAQPIVNSVKPDFLVSEERVVTNRTDREITGSFTSSVSKTFSLTYAGGLSGSLLGFLNANVSASITQSTTTTTGVTATAPVPPHGRVIGQYGVEAYVVDITMQWYRTTGPYPPYEGGACYPSHKTTGTSIAPTHYTGWRVIPG